MAKTKRQRKGTARKPDQPAEPANGHAELIRELWQAAVNLRGSIEPADYKRYVLPIIFLRFLSLRFEKRHEELEMMIGEEESEYYTADGKVAKSILDDPDEYRSAGVFKGFERVLMLPLRHLQVRLGRLDSALRRGRLLPVCGHLLFDG